MHLHTLGHMLPQPAPSSFFGSVADLLRGDYKAPGYGKVILPTSQAFRPAPKDENPTQEIPA